MNRLARFFILLASFLAIFLFKQELITPVYAGNAYYVTQDGSGNFTTIQAAANAINPGDTVYVRNGTYNEMVTIPIAKSGLSGQYFTFQAYSGEQPILDGGGSLYAGFRGYGHKEYIIIDGFEIKNYKKGVVFEKDTDPALIRSNLIIRNNHIHNNSEMGIDIRDARDSEISYNLIHDITGYTGIFHQRVTNFDIHHNTVYRCDDNGIMLSYQSDSNRIRNNLAYQNDCGTDQRYAGIAIEVDSEDNQVYNNLIYNNCHAGFLTNSPNNNIYHNVMYGNTEAQASNGPWENSFPTGNIYKNNVFVVTRSNDKGVTFWGMGYDPLLNTFDNNLYYYVNGPEKSDMVANWPANIVYSFTQWQTIGKEPNGALGNPQFVHSENNDFHLQANSPAIDKGANVGVDQDFDGNLRPQDAGYDIGAYEYVSGGPSPTVIPTPAPIPGDVNKDGSVNSADMQLVLGAWGAASGNPADLNADGWVNALDAVMVIANWTPS